MRRLAMALAVTGALGATAAYAIGNEDVGGGDVLVDASGGDPQLLDYVVGIQLGYVDGADDLRRGLGDPDREDELEKVGRVIARVGRFDAKLARRATELLDLFEKRATRETEDLVPVPDVNLEIAVPHGMRLVQGARWVADAKTAALIRWQLSAKAWDAMDHNQRAGLLLHEIFYFLHNERRHDAPMRLQNARYLRQFIAVISARSFLGGTPGEWRSMMAAFNLF
jgi:hypothetical protein